MHVNIYNTKPMSHENENGYVEAEAYENAEAKFLKKLGSGYVLEAYPYIIFFKKNL